MGIVVQKMVQAETSGVTFTVDPITKDEEKLSMEAVFGLGDVISTGEITPDLYLLNKKDLSFDEKHIAHQEWMRVLRPVSKKNKDISQVEKVKISSNWSHQQKLEDRFIKDIAKVSLIIEDNSKEPQSVEWVWESGKVWVLQSKPISESMIYKNKALDDDQLAAAEEDNKLMDLAVNIVEKGKFEEGALEEAVDSIKQKRDEDDKDAKNETKRNLSLVGKDQKDIKKKDQGEKEKQAEQNGVESKEEIELLKKELARIESKMKKLRDKPKDELLSEGLDQDSSSDEESSSEDSFKSTEGFDSSDSEDRIKSSKFKGSDKELVLKGLGGSFGSVKGEVLLLSDASKSDLKKDNSKNVILVMKEYADVIQPLVLKSDGIIAEDGGLTSDLAITCREINIPAVLNAKKITEKLETGDIVEIDGSIGSVYKISSVGDDGETGGGGDDKLVHDSDDDLGEVDGSETGGGGNDKLVHDSDDDLGKVDDGEMDSGSKTEEDISRDDSGEADGEKIDETKSTALDDIQDFKKLREKVEDTISKVSGDKSDDKEKSGDGKKKSFSDIDDLVELKKELKIKYEEKLDREAGVMPKEDLDSKEDLEVSKESVEELTEKLRALTAENLHKDSEQAKENAEMDDEEINTATKVMINADTIVVEELRKYLPFCDGVLGLSIDKLIIDSREHPLSSVDDGRFVEYANAIAERIDNIAEPIMPKEVILSIGDSKERDFRSLTRGSKYEDKSLPPDMTGIKRYLQDVKVLKRVLKIIRRVRNVFKSRNVTLAGWYPQNVETVIDFKKEVSSAGLQRTDSFKLYMILSKSSELLLLEYILEANIDGLILDAGRIAEEIGADSLDDSSVVKLLRRIVKSIKDYDMSLIVLCEDSEELAELCVEEGVYGIGVKKELVKDFKGKVKSVEEELIRSK